VAELGGGRSGSAGAGSGESPLPPGCARAVPLGRARADCDWGCFLEASQSALLILGSSTFSCAYTGSA